MQEEITDGGKRKWLIYNNHYSFSLHSILTAYKNDDLSKSKSPHVLLLGAHINIVRRKAINDRLSTDLTHLRRRLPAMSSTFLHVILPYMLPLLPQLDSCFLQQAVHTSVCALHTRTPPRLEPPFIIPSFLLNLQETLPITSKPQATSVLLLKY